ncbi:WW domain-containing adapter protein with coiled-coil-like [Aplochiton taeniatus]
MVMHARKQPTRLSDGCNDRRDSQSYQTHKSQPKSQSSSVHRYDKVRDGSSDPTPPFKMLRRSDESPVNKHGDSTGHSKAKISHTLRGKDGTNGSPQENASHNNCSHPSSDSHPNPSKPPDRRQEPADDWTEHISSSGKKYYYNCRTEVSQWEKPKDLLEKEQRQKDSAKMASNSFPRDMDYRQEALQDKITAKSTSGEQSSSNAGPLHSSSSSAAPQSLNSSSSTSSASQGAAPSTSSSSSSSSSVLSPVLQSQTSTLLQDPAVLRQLLPALQATLHMNNGSVDMARINEVLAAAVTQASLRSMLHKLLSAGPSGFNITALLSQAALHSSSSASGQAQQSSQSPLSLTSDASSPRPYVSPRNGTPQTSLLSHNKPPLLTMPPSAGSTSSGAVAAAAPQARVRRAPPSASGTVGASAQSTVGSFTPSLASHFDENLIRHVQGWPADHTEKQAARLREDAHNMGSLYMSEICTELKNLRSLVRVCEIQATLREQRILFLRQQSKELDKLKNQNSYMV